MREPNIPAALITGGVALLLAYGALWIALPTMGSLLGAGPAASAEITYEIVTTSGARELLTVEEAAPAAVLRLAGERFGGVESLRRVSEEEAATGHGELRRMRTSLAGLFLLPIGMLVLASAVGDRQRARQRGWTAISPTLTVDLGELARATGLGRDPILKLVRSINRRGWAQLVVHESASRVADSRLSNNGINVDYCPYCNARASAHLKADLVHVPTCPSCMNEYPREQLIKQSEALVRKLVASPPPAPRGAPPRFSVGLFALLTLVFPPLAIVHAWRAAW